ncbi:MAG: hypothetical protein MZV63_41330 [Marinilabiliales bacterium]|nr:hypothetical protein [Marinilabiliales bacterium]
MEEGLNALIVNPSVIIGPGYWDENSGVVPAGPQRAEVLYERSQRLCGCSGRRPIPLTPAHGKPMLPGRAIHRLRCKPLLPGVLTMVAKHMNLPSVNVPPCSPALPGGSRRYGARFTGSKPEVTREMSVTTIGGLPVHRQRQDQEPAGF